MKSTFEHPLSNLGRYYIYIYNIGNLRVHTLQNKGPHFQNYSKMTIIKQAQGLYINKNDMCMYIYIYYILCTSVTSDELSDEFCDDLSEETFQKKLIKFSEEF